MPEFKKSTLRKVMKSSKVSEKSARAILSKSYYESRKAFNERDKLRKRWKPETYQKYAKIWREKGYFDEIKQKVRSGYGIITGRKIKARVPIRVSA